MTEPRTREIQLTAKQLVFIFMSTLLVAVVVFLLGVWVGRGIGAEQSGPISQAGAVGTLVELDKDKDKKPADAKANEKYDYPKTLQGPAAGSGAAQSPTPPPAPVAVPQPKPEPPPPDTKQAAPAGKPSANDTSWYVQIDAFSSKANADRQAAGLKARGYATLVTPGPPFKVRVGPFPHRAAAEEALTRLRKEPGVKNPSVTASR